jgi:hypothetical protein
MALPPGIYNIRIPSGSNVVCPIGMGNGLTVAAPTQNANQKVSLYHCEILGCMLIVLQWFVNGGVIMSMVSGQVTFVGGDLTTSADDFFPWNINIIVE